MSGYGPLILIILAVFGLAGGIGITSIGPGGILPTIGLVALTSLTPARVAGTAIVTHIATGAVGTAAYLRSGELRKPHTRRTAVVLSGAAVVGTPIGIMINSALSARWFGIVLGVLTAAVAVLVLIRHRAHQESEPTDQTGLALIIGVGLFVAVAAGIVGIGGPMLTVPLLVAARMRPLEAVATSQAQSVIIAVVGSAGYLLHGDIDWLLAVVVGIPELAGVLIGWRIARALPTRALRFALVTALLAVSPYLVLHG